MHRRHFLGLTSGLAAGATLTSLTGCGSDLELELELDSNVNLVFVAADYGDSASNSSKKYWESLARDFEKKNPDVTVDVRIYNWTEVDKKVSDMVAAGDAPDIAQIGSYADYAAQDMLYSADEVLRVSTQADIIGSLAGAGEVKRTQYGLPFVSSTRMLFYNKALFRKAGIAKAPADWSQLAAAARVLKDNGVPMPYGLPLGPEEPQAEAMMWMLGVHGGYTDSVGTYTIDSATNIEAFQWLKRNLVSPGLTGTDPVTTDRQDVFDAFLKGRAGMINGHPTLLTQAKEKGIDLGTVPIPGKDGQIQESFGVADWLMAFRQKGHQEQIGRFLETIYSPENALAFLKQYNLLPVTTSASDAMRGDAAFKDLWKFLDRLPGARFYPVGKPSWGPVSERLKTTIGKAATGDPASVLGTLQKYAETKAAADASVGT